MVEFYKKNPSQLLSIDDPYIAYCLDEAIAEYVFNIQQGKKPRTKANKEKNSGLQMLIGKKD